jgi:hypothetical protein
MQAVIFLNGKCTNIYNNQKNIEAEQNAKIDANKDKMIRKITKWFEKRDTVITHNRREHEQDNEAIQRKFSLVFSQNKKAFTQMDDV